MTPLASQRRGVREDAIPVKAENPTLALVKAIAMDIGKEVVAYIDYMYPEAPRSCTSTFRLSLRNSIYNEIMAALEVTDEGKIIARLNERKKFRRKHRAVWKKIRTRAKEQEGRD